MESRFSVRRQVNGVRVPCEEIDRVAAAGITPTIVKGSPPTRTSVRRSRVRSKRVDHRWLLRIATAASGVASHEGSASAGRPNGVEILG